MRRHVIYLVLFGLCAVNFVGCANTQPTHFYLLQAMGESAAPVTLESTQPAISLGIGPIDFPKYLDRPQIVTRISAHEINLAEFHKWAEPLQENVANVLEENLSALLSTDRIVQYPWRRSNHPDYQLTASIIQFDGTTNQETVLKVRWALIESGSKRILQKKISQFSEVLLGAEYENLVEAMSQTLASFSQEIASAVNLHNPRQ